MEGTRFLIAGLCEVRANMNYNLFVDKKMQRGPLKVVICGKWKYCSKVIHRPGVCCCVVLSVVRKMNERGEGTR